MRKTLLIFAIIIATATAKAQQGYDFISITGYRSNRSTLGAKAGLEFSRIYNRRFALYANYFQNFSGRYKEYTVGVFYKPQLFQNRNTGLRMVFGGGIGTNRVDFQAVPQIGFEWYLIFRNNWEVSLLPDGAYATAGPYYWRYQVQAAIKFPLL
jgi:hypothetical protein